MSWLRDRRFHGWLALTLLACGYAMWLSKIPLIEPDEGRYAEIPREMLRSGDFVTPRLSGAKYFEKPPLYYWLNAASLAVFGRNELAVRLWNVAFGLGGLWLTWRLALALFGAAIARRSTLFLATTILYSMLSGANSIDPALTFFVTGTLTCFALATRGGRRERWWWLGAALGAALAVLTKGLIGLVIPGLVAGGFVLLTRRWDLIRRAPWLLGGALFFAVAAPWHILMAQRNPDFLEFYFVHEHFLRYTTKVHARSGPVWYFVPVVLIGALPWTGYLLRAIADVWRDRRRLLEANTESTLFLWVWVAVVFGFFSASGSKLVPYILPLFAPLSILLAKTSLEATPSRLRRVGFLVALVVFALLSLAVAMASTGIWVDLPQKTAVPFAVVAALGAAAFASFAGRLVWRSAEQHAVRWAAVSVVTFCAALLSVLPAYAAGRTARAAAACLEAQPDHEGRVYSFRSYPQTLPFYLDETIRPVFYQGELEFGLLHLEPAYREQNFPRLDEFLPRWLSTERIYLIIEDNHLKEAAEAGITGFELQHAGRYIVWSNQPAAPCQTPP